MTVLLLAAITVTINKQLDSYTRRIYTGDGHYKVFPIIDQICGEKEPDNKQNFVNYLKKLSHLGALEH